MSRMVPIVMAKCYHFQFQFPLLTTLQCSSLSTYSKNPKIPSLRSDQRQELQLFGPCLISVQSLCVGLVNNRDCETFSLGRDVDVMSIWA